MLTLFHFKKNNSFLLKKSGHFSDKIIVDGIEMTTSELQFNKRPEEVYILRSKVESKGYRNKSSKEEISEIEYEKRKCLLDKKVIKSKDEDSIEFNSIEDEIEYLVFTKSWFKEFETITTKHLVENIIEVVYETSEYEEIVSLPIADGNLNSFKPLYRYTFDFKKVVKEFAEKYLFKELIKDSITTGRFFCFSFSNEYCKVNNKYIFSNGLLKQLVTETVDTYQECVKKRESNRKIIEYCFLVEHNLLRFPSFSEKERDEVRTSLLQLKNSISSLNVFKNNEAEKRSILTSLQSLITKTSKV